MSLGDGMSNEDFELLVNELRQTIQSRTCCVPHAEEVVRSVLVSFAMDRTRDDAKAAADHIRTTAGRLAKQVEQGVHTMLRPRH
jgi:hypothetical protein